MNQTLKYLKSTEGRKLTVLLFCTAAFIGALLVSAITASKLYIVGLFGWEVTVPVGTSLFAVTFLSTDAISEIFGKVHATLLVFLGFVARVATLLFLTFAVAIPGAGAPIWDNQVAYEAIFSGSNNIIFAGIVTYPISQMVDVLLFHYLKKRHEGKNRLWLRNNISTFTSQVIDSSVFIGLAFGAILPFGVLINIILGQVIVKWVVASLDTPFVYLIRNYAQGRKILDFKG